MSTLAAFLVPGGAGSSNCTEDPGTPDPTLADSPLCSTTSNYPTPTSSTTIVATSRQHTDLILVRQTTRRRNATRLASFHATDSFRASMVRDADATAISKWSAGWIAR
jgi:hypothetical protein